MSHIERAAREPQAPVEIYDTTLRDGTQREGLSLTCDAKLRVARALDRLGVAYVEAGWPGSNPKDVEIFERARDIELTHARWVAFGSTCKSHVEPDEDPQLRTLLAAQTPVVTIFGKSSLFQVNEVLRTSPEENLRMISQSVAYLVAEGREVIYDAEHFFDAWRQDPGYALETLAAAAQAGAHRLVLCDTNGGSLPWDVEAAVRAAFAAHDTPLGIHAHDDGGLAVANSLAALRAGAVQVQGTMHGWGERCGNANLCAIIPDLELKLGRACLPPGHLARLMQIAEEVGYLAGLATPTGEPYVGRSAFAHKGGVHVAAMRRHPQSYEHVAPASVGNRSRFVISELAGRGNVRARAEELGVNLHETEARSVLESIKVEESRGYSFDAAEASVAVRIARAQPEYEPPFRVLDYRVLTGRDPEGRPVAEATVKVAIGARVRHTAAEHEGPVAALDEALRAAIEPDLPEIAQLALRDFSVRILDGRLAAAAVTRVTIEMHDGERSFCSVGASASVVEASLAALVDGMEHGLSGLCARSVARAAG